MMSARASEILIRYQLISLPKTTQIKANFTSLISVLNNIAYYGYAISQKAYEQLMAVSEDNLINWWQELEKVLKKITGDDKNIADYVVYKNFPNEVLAMSEAQYWKKQILMYWGFPNHYFTQTEVERPKMQENIKFCVLHLATENSLLEIFNHILYLPNRWTEEQWQDIQYLLPEFIERVEIEKITFKENLVQVLISCLKKNLTIKVRSATDILRLAIGLSEGDISLATPSKFRTFKRRERKYLLNLLNNTSHLEEDIFRRKNVWKKLMFALHPGDYESRFPRVVEAYHILFNNLPITAFNGQLECFLKKRDKQALQLLKTRPGEFSRRLNHCLRLFEEEAAQVFIEVIPQLKLIQLLKLQSYLETINYRIYRTIAPKGNWTKMQILQVVDDNMIDETILQQLLSTIAKEIKVRVDQFAPVVSLQEETKMIKLQTNDSDLTNYGRGTIFPIPNHIKFMRTASYWRSGKTSYNIWYDNSWNFFDRYWKGLGSCCWTDPYFGVSGAVFSGDPTNSKDLQGNACQLIDLYLDNLKESKVRYAVWSLLCYSRLSFDKAEEVYASLQWGENPREGNLFEPSRCQFAFPVKGNNLTKYIAMIDLEKNHLIYLDANLYGRVNTAANNLERLEKNMPAFMEYLDTLPSVYDLFKHQESGLCVAYSDRNLNLVNQKAYVFRPENQNNNFTSFSLTNLLNS